VTEYLSRGSLYTLLHDDCIQIDLEHIRRFALDTCNGMVYLHACNILHRDLKTHNLLVSENWTVKVCDFGLSRTLSDAAVTQTLTACGTPSWAAPEVLKDMRYSAKADVYSFGICLWEMCTRDRPYQNMTTPQVVIAVAIEGHRLPIPESIRDDFRKMMRDCWHIEPRFRPLFSGLADSFERMECPAPTSEWPSRASSSIRAMTDEMDVSSSYASNFVRQSWGPKKTSLKEL